MIKGLTTGTGGQALLTPLPANWKVPRPVLTWPYQWPGRGRVGVAAAGLAAVLAVAGRVTAAYGVGEGSVGL
jgi:hypothetical protein